MLSYLIGLSALSFLGYGISCIWSQHMKAEFIRYGLARYRVLVGSLQLLGALGLIVGFLYPSAGFVASTGLALQMLLGVGVRLKIKDKLHQGIPAFAYFGLNSYIAIELFRNGL